MVLDLSFCLREIREAIKKGDYERAEYKIYLILEEDMKKGSLLLSEFLVHYKKDLYSAKKIIYRQILANKKDIRLRLLYIKVLLLLKDFTKSIKWCQKSLLYSNPEEKAELYYILAKIFYLTNRPERSQRYLYLCLQINKKFLPALHIKPIIERNLQYEFY